MTRREELERLRDAVKRGSNPTQAEWCDVFPDTPSDDGYPRSMMAVQANMGWVDAALALKDEALRGWGFDMGSKSVGAEFYAVVSNRAAQYRKGSANADSPARALLLATLEALIAHEDENDPS